MKSHLKALASRFPGLAATLRPAAHAVIAVATRDNITWTKHKLGMDTRSRAEREHDEAAALAEALGRAALAEHQARELKETEANDRLDHAANDPAAPGIGTLAAGRNVLMLVVSDLRIDPRVEREARALAAAGYHVTVICPDPTVGKDPSVSVDWGKGITAIFTDWKCSQYVGRSPGFKGGMLFDAALKVARELKPFAVHGHDLNTCYVASALARQTGAHLVVDFHEWTSENVHWSGAEQGWQPYPEDWRQELKALEHKVVLEASASITVSEHIAKTISEEVGGQRQLTLIRNVPSLALEPTRPYLTLKQQLGLPEDRFVLLYQGGTGPSRLIEPIIEALAHAPACTFVIRGPSLDRFGEDYRAIAEAGGFKDRLFLMPPVPSKDVVAAARGADAGIYSVLGVGKNFIYALPNKIFEYAAAGLPVLSADYPEASKFVREHDIGLTFAPTDPRSIAAAINLLIDEPALAKRLRINSAALTADLLGQDEWAKLVALYDALPKAPPEGRVGA